MTDNRSVQVVRHTTIVLAGAASLTLTVAAGAYIVQQMANTQRTGPAIGESVTPPAIGIVPPRTDRVEPVASAGQAVFHGRVGRAVISTAPIEPASAEPAPIAAPAPIAPQPDPAVAPSPAPAAPSPDFGGRVGVGDTYLGAHVGQAGTDTVTFTVDTNLFANRPAPAQPERSADVTRVHTEIDTRRGGVSLSVSDPAHGEHDLRVDRTPAPAQVAAGPART